MTETKKSKRIKKPTSNPKKGWQKVTTPDGAEYNVLHDTGAYDAYVRKTRGGKPQDTPKST